ncbi:MAG: hypothetical protein V3W41_12995 [Planctomycetota bacterium]
MIKEPKIRGKNSAGYKTSWLCDEYTISARVFYVKQHQEAQAALNSACAATQDPNVIRHYERMVAIEETIALLTYNEQERDDD